MSCGLYGQLGHKQRIVLLDERLLGGSAPGDGARNGERHSLDWLPFVSRPMP
jgi:hypothetical protein